MKKKVVLLALIFSLCLIFVACQKPDVESNPAVTSFKEVLDIIPASIKADEIYGGWALTAPDGSARFIWSKDFSKSPYHDALIEFDSKPFVDAGLDLSKLPAGMILDNKIMLGAKFGYDSLTYDGDATPIASFEKLIKLYPSQIKYHESMDHYGVALGNGNIFAWAKDMLQDNSDIEFIIDPQILINAGVSPSEVSGWDYVKTSYTDLDNKEVEIYKFIKSFNLK